MKQLLTNINTLFKMNTNKQSVQMEKTEPSFNLENEITENLFVEKDEPVITETVAQQAPESMLSIFLRRDFHSKGYNDGYRYHAADILDNSKRLIRSEFREVMDKMIDDFRLLNSKLQKHLVDAKHLTTKSQEKVSARISEIADSILRLEEEKENSTMDEGLVAKCLHHYRDGFIRGFEDYNEEILVMGYTGLFK